MFAPTQFDASNFQLKSCRKYHKIGVVLPLVRQIWRGKKTVSQKTGSCRIDSKQKTNYLLEWAKIRRNFAMSIRQNNDLWLTETDKKVKTSAPQGAYYISRVQTEQ